MVKQYAMLYVKDRGIKQTFTGGIKEYSNDIFDALTNAPRTNVTSRSWDVILGSSDVLVVENLNGQPISDAQGIQIIRTMVDNFGTDGFAVIWRLYRGSLFIAVEENERQARSQCLAFLEGKKPYTQPQRYQRFDFYGLLSAELVRKGEPVQYRPSVQTMLREVSEMQPPKSQDAKRLRAQMIALSRCVADSDLSGLIEGLYDELRQRLDDGDADVKYSEIMDDPAVVKWAAHLRSCEKQANEATESLTVPQLVYALKFSKISETERWNAEDMESSLRSIMKIYQLLKNRMAEGKTLGDEKSLCELIFDIFHRMEFIAEHCMWCGAPDPEPHYAKCDARRVLLGFSRLV